MLSKNHCYAIKKYFGPCAKDYYQREVKAFTRLRDNSLNYPSPSMIGFHGSYVHRDTYNIILEFADGGNLEQYFKSENPPTRGVDIIAFWRSLFEVLKAMFRLHEQSLSEDDPHCHTILQGYESIRLVDCFTPYAEIP